ncbi:DsbA family oxidoreductase [Streptomyces sp. TLI_171]|uniref:DsbA family oxidoreductase n=1 Tax=Streptomyces sp. TLI_171 TaxID=1938859 RepID=UPI000C1A3053|nr:DsbA family oxidoreductase [Streptomyces sp. TLI_171]RKE20550.1 putative DsbA family dithiol-disulfide isomerase [Streptomyces sp. TLI_171]
MKVEIYSDIACPWCYVGKRRFEQALGQFEGKDGVEVVYRPYQLVPDAPEQARPHREWLAERYGPQSLAMDARITEVGKAVGIDYDFDAALEVNTLRAHRLLHLAETEYGPAVQAALKERLLKAHFSEGVDVGDIEALADLAAETGIDRARAAAYLADGEGEDETRAALAEARAIGVTAVPTFVFEGKWAVQGGQEAETFLQVLRQVEAETAKQIVPLTPAAGTCDDGACAI